MATATNIVIPDNKEVVQPGQSTQYRQFRVETATTVMNGRLVIGGTTDGDVITCTDENVSALGWVVRDETLAVYRENDRTTEYTAGDIVAVCSGPGTKLVVRASAAVDMGDKMVPAASGQVKPFSADPADTIVCKAEQSLTGAGFLVVTILI